MNVTPSQAAIAAVTLFCGPRPAALWEHHSASESLDELTHMNEGLQAEIDALNEDLRRWRESERYREHVIRDELGYGRRSDLTIVYEELE